MRKVCSFMQKKALRQRFTGVACRKPSTGRGEGQGWSIKCQAWGNNICSTSLNFVKDFGILLQYRGFYWFFLGLESWNKMQHCFFPTMLNTESIWFFDSLIELLCYHLNMLWHAYVVKMITLLLDSIFLWVTSLGFSGFMHGQQPGLCSGQMSFECAPLYLGCYHRANHLWESL